MRLSREEVVHIASLVRIGMTEEDIERFQDQLSNILQQFEVLSTVDTQGAPPMAHPLEMTNVLRGDTPGDSLPKDDVLANAPLREDDYLRVKAVLED